MTVTTPTDEDHRTANALLVLRVADLEQARDRQKLRADGLYAANLRLAADAIVREEALQGDLTAARRQRDEARRERDRARINARVSDEMTGAMRRDLRDARTAIAGSADTITRLVGENLALGDAHTAAAAEIAELKARLARTPRRLTRRRDRSR